MKSIKNFALLAAFCLPLCAYTQSKTSTRAGEGEQVWLIVNYVKADSKQQFE